MTKTHNEVTIGNSEPQLTLFQNNIGNYIDTHQPIYRKQCDESRLGFSCGKGTRDRIFMEKMSRTQINAKRKKQYQIPNMKWMVGKLVAFRQL